MSKIHVFAVAIFLAVAHGSMLAHAQTSTPGPTNPTPQANPLAKPNSDLVINPTEEECQKGWHSDLKWTREQFENFCGQMKSSK
jgi:hypothetical protein